MTDPILISIIVLCYNVAGFLPKTFGCIQNQSYPNWECIAVNDGSTDTTEQELKKWAQRDARFKMVSQKNSGAATARNTGLKQASGECIYFLDADDLMLENTLEDLFGIYDPSIDIVIGKNAKVDGHTTDNPTILPHFDEEEVMSRDHDILKLALESELLPVVWNKLFSRDFINKNNLRFKDSILHEDELWFFQTMYLAKKIAFNSKVTYFYNVGNENSVMQRYSLCNLHSLLEIIQIIYHTYYLPEKNDGSKKMIGNYILHLQIDAISVFYRYLKNHKASYEDEGTAVIKQHLAEYRIPRFVHLEWDRNRQFDLFIKYAPRNPKTAFKLIRNRNKRNVLKFFENVYLKLTH